MIGRSALDGGKMLGKLPSMKVQLRCSFGRRFPSAGGDITCGPYRIIPIPTIAGGEQEGIFEFIEPERAGGHSNPEREGEIILGFLSLLLNCEIQKTGFMINGIDISRNKDAATLACLDVTPIERVDFSESFHQLLRCCEQIIKQFNRACKAYALALHASTIDITLAFLLLVTSIECLSSQEEVIPNIEFNKSSSTERFCRVITTFCSDVATHFPADGLEGFRRHLKTIYYVHRSGFVHSGKEVSIAATVADRAGFPAITHFEDGQEISTPGLTWFFGVVHDTLLGFLEKYPNASSEPNKDAIFKIARESALLTMRCAG
jgi:hypothetical protein